MTDVHRELLELFRDVFEDDQMLVEEGMESSDIAGWDSLAHINLLIAAEKRFGIRFTVAEMSRLKQPGQTVGSLRELIESKIAAR